MVLTGPVIRRRLALCMAIFLALFIVLCARLFYLQLVASEELQRIAQAQWTSESVIAPARGMISDRNGSVIAMSATAYTASVNPRQVADAEALAEIVSPILNLEASEIVRKASDKSKSSVILKRQLSREAAAKAAFLDEVEEVLFDAFGGFASGSISASAAVGGETAKQYVQKTAKVTDAESYARRLQEVMPELGAENGETEGEKERTSWPGKKVNSLQSSVENKWEDDILKLGIRYLNKNDELFINAKKIKPLEGFEDIVTHGDPISLVFKDADGGESNVSAEEFVNILMNDPNYKGGNIRLIACQVAADGGNIPRYIAQRLNVTVLAPTETVNVDFDGNMILADNEEDARSGIETGRWIYFEPKQEGGTK